MEIILSRSNRHSKTTPVSRIRRACLIFLTISSIFAFLSAKNQREHRFHRSNAFVHFCLSTAHNAFHVVFFVTNGQVRFRSSRKRVAPWTMQFNVASTNSRFCRAFADRFFALLNLGFIITGIITRWGIVTEDTSTSHDISRMNSERDHRYFVITNEKGHFSARFRARPIKGITKNEINNYLFLSPFLSSEWTMKRNENVHILVWRRNRFDDFFQ